MRRARKRKSCRDPKKVPSGVECARCGARYQPEDLQEDIAPICDDMPLCPSCARPHANVSRETYA